MNTPIMNKSAKQQTASLRRRLNAWGRRLAAPLIVFAFLVIGLEVFCFIVSPYRKQMDAAECNRNPMHKYYGWPEYLDGRTKPGKKLVLLIGNSQAHGVGMADPDDIYFAHLKKRFGREQPEVQMENWAVPGMRTADMELLTLQALRRDASHIFIVLFCRNFDVPKKVNLDFPRSDLRLLLGDPRTWRHARQTLFAKQMKSEDLIRAMVARNLNSVRVRGYLYRKIGFRLPHVDETFFLGSAGPRNRAHRILTDDMRTRQDEAGQGDENGSAEPEQQQEALPDIVLDRVDKRLETFDGFWRHFQQRLREHPNPPKIVFVWQPLNPKASVTDSEEVRRFLTQADKTLGKAGISCYDMRRDIQPAHFIDNSHFTKSGHLVFAEKFGEIIENEL